MASTIFELPFLSNLGLMLTFKCTVVCPHCLVDAGPHRSEEMPLQQVLNWIDQAKHYREGLIKGLALTGGEPFYNLENLESISAYGRSKGFIVSAVTNAFWATDKNTAVAILSRVPAISMLSISTDVYHQKLIPFEYVANALWAVKKLGRFYNIAVCTDTEEEPQYQKIIEDLKALGEFDKIRTTFTFPVGRAQKYARHFHYSTSDQPSTSACSMASSPVVFPDGTVNACIGPVLTLLPAHPLHLGNLNTDLLQHILDRAELNPVLHAIRIWGLKKLIALLKEYGYENLLPKEYINNCICDACYKLLSDVRIVDALETILQDEQIKHMIAYARIYYLKETHMAERYHLQSAGSAN